MAPKKDIPTPEMLLVEAQGAVERDAPLDIYEYGKVIAQLRYKNYSFGKIADWLGERLQRPINKGVVFRVFQDWEADHELDFAEEPDLPTDVDEAERITDEAANAVRDFIDDYCNRRAIPQFFGTAGLQRALASIQREEADERAAQEADAASESPAAKEENNK